MVLKIIIIRQLVKEESLEDDVNSKINPFFNSFYFDSENTETNLFEITKIIEVPKTYTKAMLEMDFNFVNALWVENTAYIKINDHIYWMEHHNWSAINDISNL